MKLRWPLTASFLLLSACAGTPIAPARSATLTVGDVGAQALHDALRVLGKPSDQWKIGDKADPAGPPIVILSFNGTGTSAVALYFYGDTFVEAVNFDRTTGYPPIRKDYKDLDAGDGTRAYLVESQGTALTVRDMVPKN